MEKIKTSQAGNNWFHLRKNCCAGFTLLELIIVILIASIAASIVAVSLGRTYDKRIFNETSKKVFLTLKHAREVALLEKTQVIFNLNPETNTFWLNKNNTVYGKTQAAPEQIAITGKPIIFFPKGNSSGGIVRIKDKKEREYVIEVDPVLGTPSFKER